MIDSIVNGIKKYFIKPAPTPQVEEEFHRDDKTIIEILDNMEEMVYQIDRNFIVKWANKSVLERHPTSLERKCYEAFSHQQGICQDCFCQKAIISGSIVKGIKINNSFTVDDGIHYVETISIPVNIETFAAGGAISISKEITDTQEYRSRLISSKSLTLSTNHLLEIIQKDYLKEFEALDYPIVITDLDLKVIYYNQNCLYIDSLKFEAGKFITEILPSIISSKINSIRELALLDKYSGAISFSLNPEDENSQLMSLTCSSLKSGDNNKCFALNWSIHKIDFASLQQTPIYEIPEILSDLRILKVDSSACVISWSSSLTKMFGWSEEEILGLPNPLFSLDFLDSILKSDKKKLKTDISINDKTGNQRRINITFYKIENLATSDVITCLIDEIQFSNHPIASVDGMEEIYETFIKNFSGVAFKSDLNLIPVILNGAIKALTGHSKEEILDSKKSLLDIIHLEDRIVIQDIINKLRNRGRIERELEFRFIHQDGSFKWVHLYFHSVIDSTGKAHYLQGILYNITHRKEVEDELKLSRENYRNLAMYSETSREEEKKRLAIEIHDELGHALTALKLELAWLIKKKFIRQEVLFEKVRKMNELIESTIRKVRTISSQLRPSVLDHFGLIAALEWQTAEFQKRSAIRCKLNVGKQDFKLEEQRSTALFRIFQEILTNVARHAKATRVDVTLERVTEEVILRVSDNGRGIKQEQINNKKSLGLLGMTERALAVGGKLTISGVIGMGTTVTITVPLK
jgi:PAS domain S-box-containing protein